jgi:hypothetical protein
MGKGTIVGGGAAGLYSVQANLNTSNVAADISRMQDAITACNAIIAATNNQITAKQAEISALEAQITSMLSQADKITISKNLVTKQNELYVLLTTKNAFELQKKGLQLRIEILQTTGAVQDPVMSAWCADLTENLTGIVSTIEVPGEIGTVLIRPGYTDRAVYNRTQEGQLYPAVGQDPAQCFYNWAMLPGWQKWMPKYRFGTITSIDYNTDKCDVTVEAAKSSAQDIDVNSATFFNDIPIEYMS